jgi:hypothetical protein
MACPWRFDRNELPTALGARMDLDAPLTLRYQNKVLEGCDRLILAPFGDPIVALPAAREHLDDHRGVGQPIITRASGRQVTTTSGYRTAVGVTTLRSSTSTRPRPERSAALSAAKILPLIALCAAELPVIMRTMPVDELVALRLLGRKSEEALDGPGMRPRLGIVSFHLPDLGLIMIDARPPSGTSICPARPCRGSPPRSQPMKLCQSSFRQARLQLMQIKVAGLDACRHQGSVSDNR